MKKNRKWAVAALCLLLVLLFSTTAFAQSNSVEMLNSAVACEAIIVPHENADAEIPPAPVFVRSLFEENASAAPRGVPCAGKAGACSPMANSQTVHAIYPDRSECGNWFYTQTRCAKCNGSIVPLEARYVRCGAYHG